MKIIKTYGTFWHCADDKIFNFDVFSYRKNSKIIHIIFIDININITCDVLYIGEKNGNSDINSLEEYVGKYHIKKQ